MPGGVAIQRNVTVDLKGLPRQLDSLSIPAASINWRPTLNDVNVYLTSKAKESFDRQRAPDGSPWAPLKRQRNRRRDRRARKRGGGTGQKVLRDTGLLMASYSAISATKGAVRLFGQFSLETGSAVDYAGFHATGTRHMPARPAAGVTPKMADFIGDIVVDRLTRQYFGAN